ncbi:MAG TPA: oligosaccharide flippase family protein [Longimicrobium sp.]|nr:oligosaccharide flippase family protein [Longimicrobium sp.]
MLRAFLKDGLAYGLAGILARSVSLLLVPLYTRVLAPADYGTLDLLVVLASLVNLTVALEISQAVVRLYPDAPTPDDRVELASTALFFTLGAYALFAAVAAVGAAPLGGVLLDAPERASLIRLAVASIWAGGILYFAQAQLRTELKARGYAVVSLVVAGVTIAVSVVLVLWLRWGVAGVLWAQLAGNLAGAALALHSTRSSFALRFDGAKLRAMLAFSAPLVPSGIAVFVALYVDRIVIKEMMTLHDVGLFGVGYRLASLASLLVLGFQAALTPLVYTHYREPDTPRQIARLFRWFLALGIGVVAVLSLFAPELLRVFAAPEYASAARVVPLLAPAVVASGMYVFAPGLALAKRTGSIALVTTLGAVLNTVLNLLLVPRLGIAGAAASTLVSALCVFAAYMASSQRHYPVPHPWGRLGVATLGSAAVLALGARLSLDTLPALAARSGLLVGLVLLLLGTGLVEPREIRQGAALARARLRPAPPDPV